MKNTNVFMLFRFNHPSTDVTGSEHGRYQIILFFDENGKISEQEMKKASIWSEKYSKAEEFKTKEDLTNATQNFIDNNHYEKAYLLSANDFNIGIESCHHLDAFRQIFQDYGICLNNAKRSEKSLLSKIF